MSSHGKLQPPLKPRNGQIVQLLSVCRVSDLKKQDQRSPQDQEALLRRIADDNVEYPYDMRVLAGSGSGECLEREEYRQLIELIETDTYDAVLTEDLGRIVRRIHAHLICELAVDHGTRLISINDHVDTAQDGWQDHSIFAAWHHERSNRDTSSRIKRTHRARFLQGGCLPLPIYGYVKKPGAKTEDDLLKDPAAEAILVEWFHRLDRGMLYSEIADWLNDCAVPTGPYCRNERWDGRMVARVTHNWILKGVRYRNKRQTRRNNNSGKYKSEKADSSDLAIREVPALAFFDKAYYDRVVAQVDARNSKYRRAGRDGVDTRQNVPKKRSRFPGQCIYCGICGRLFVFGGHGQTDHLMCSGAREYVCWNGVTVDGPLAAEKISTAVFAQIEALEDFDSAFLELVCEESKALDVTRQERLRKVAGEIDRNEREAANLMKFILGGDESPRVRQELMRLDAEKNQLQFEQEQAMTIPSRLLEVPPVNELKEMSRAAFKDLAIESYEFAKLLRNLTGKIMVYPYRLCDGGHIVLRAHFQPCLGNLLQDVRLREALQRPLERSVVVDLFVPPQRVHFRAEVVARRAMKETERTVAQALGIKQPAVQHAAALDRLMQSLGLVDPYVRLMEPPKDYSKLRRHLHQRYNFTPLPGYSSQ